MVGPVVVDSHLDIGPAAVSCRHDIGAVSPWRIFLVSLIYRIDGDADLGAVVVVAQLLKLTMPRTRDFYGLRSPVSWCSLTVPSEC